MIGLITMKEQDLGGLEQKIDRLITLCARLQQENQSLLEREAGLLKERSKLLEKNELARSRVENMIARLKGLSSE